jgi:hypothetical protein
VQHRHWKIAYKVTRNKCTEAELMILPRTGRLPSHNRRSGLQQNQCSVRKGAEKEKEKEVEELRHSYLPELSHKLQSVRFSMAVQ